MNVTIIGMEDATRRFPNNPVVAMPLSGFSSLGLMLVVDESRRVIPYYMLNPADGILTSSSPGWLRLGTTEFSQIDVPYGSYTPAYISTGTAIGSATVREPETCALILAGLGLLAFALRRRKYLAA